ncbi:set domain-containing protein rms1 [Stemphylium lycopersici]|nr:set domain-containing protein rms1 [Stemphylium lycopersici]
MGDFQEASERFLKWFRSCGGTFNDDLLEIQDLRSQDAGRGIIAKKNIPEDTTLFAIPRDIIINVQTSALAEKLPEIFEESMDDEDSNECLEPLDSWASLILVMLYEYLQGSASKWKPYIDILPQTFDTPLFWSEAELKELEGTSLTREKIGKEESDEMLRSRILPIVTKHANVFYPEVAERLNEDDLLSLAHRMGSTIMSYAFDLENEGEQSDDEEDGWVEDRDGKTLMGMVPMADMLNANAEFNVMPPVYTAHVHHGDQLQVASLRENIPAGTEILNYYGPLPSSELLRRYGYVTPEHRRYDIAELPWNLVRTALGEELELSKEVIQEIEADVEKKMDSELEEFFIIERDSGDPSSYGTLEQLAVLREISPELDEQLKLFLKAVRKRDPKRKRDDGIFNTVVERALKARLAQYPTSVEDDEALLSKDNIGKRHRMAVEVRLGEKRVLQEALVLVQGGNNTVHGGEERAGKRTKRSS